MITFSEKQNKKLIQIYLECLYSRKELIQYQYPYQMFYEDDAIGEHFEKCRFVLLEFLLDRIPGIADKSGIKLSNPEIEKIASEKINEILKVVAPDINKYAEVVTVTYIDLSPSVDTNIDDESINLDEDF